MAVQVTAKQALRQLIDSLPNDPQLLETAGEAIRALAAATGMVDAAAIPMRGQIEALTATLKAPTAEAFARLGERQRADLASTLEALDRALKDQSLEQVQAAAREWTQRVATLPDDLKDRLRSEGP